MQKFIEINYFENNKNKLMSINIDKIIAFRPNDNDKNGGTIITLSKIYGRNGQINNSILNATIEYEDLKSKISNLLS